VPVIILDQFSIFEIIKINRVVFASQEQEISLLMEIHRGYFFLRVIEAVELLYFVLIFEYINTMV